MLTSESPVTSFLACRVDIANFPLDYTLGRPKKGKLCFCQTSASLAFVSASASCTASRSFAAALACSLLCSNPV